MNSGVYETSSDKAHNREWIDMLMTDIESNRTSARSLRRRGDGWRLLFSYAKAGGARRTVFVLCVIGLAYATGLTVLWSFMPGDGSAPAGLDLNFASRVTAAGSLATFVIVIAVLILRDKVGHWQRASGQNL